MDDYQAKVFRNDNKNAFVKVGPKGKPIETVYITCCHGETERHLNIRPGEYLSLSAITSKRVNNSKKSAVKDHCLFFNHLGFV